MSYKLREFLDPDATKRKETALRDVQKIARYFHENFQSEVWGIGSLFSDEEKFRMDSDIDLVVSKIPPEKFLRILNEVDSMSSIPIDIIPLEDANHLILASIQTPEFSKKII